MNPLINLRCLCTVAVLACGSAIAADDEPVAAVRPSVPLSAVPSPAVSAQVDALFEASWRDAGVQPQPGADDAVFMRRVYLDLIGIIPEAGDVRDFLTDRSDDKRDRLIDRLLTHPRHAAHLATVWRDVLLPRESPGPGALVFERWLQDQFRSRTPYDQIVREILLARGTLEQSPQGAFYAAHSTKPSELASNSSRVFMGMQIRCAECHDHPFDTWKQGDFWGLAAFFARVQGPTEPFRGEPLVDVDTGDVQHPVSKLIVAPAFPGGKSIEMTTSEPRRAMLARWMTEQDNPWFAKAAVNRVWWLMFGRGLVDPVDNMGEQNSPTHPAVLDLLAADFVAHNYDVDRLIRILAGTRVYQLASVTTRHDATYTDYSAMIVRSLSSRQIYDCMIRATGRRDPLESATIEFGEQRREFLAQIDVPIREAAEFQGGIPQTLSMLNGPLVAQLTNPLTSDLVAALADSPFLTNEQRIDAIFLSAISRYPTDEERTAIGRWMASTENSGDVARSLSDLLWALINSSEFSLYR